MPNPGPNPHPYPDPHPNPHPHPNPNPDPNPNLHPHQVIQGVLMMKATAIPSKEILTRLWCHESLRVFCDRLIDVDDRDYFQHLLCALYWLTQP